MKPTFDSSRPAAAHNPFIVPEGYFARFQERLMQQIATVQARLAVRDLPFIKWIPFVGAASVAALIVLFTQIVNPSPLNVESTGANVSQSSWSDVDAAYDYLTAGDGTNLTYYETDY